VDGQHQQGVQWHEPHEHLQKVRSHERDVQRREALTALEAGNNGNRQLRFLALQTIAINDQGPQDLAGGETRDEWDTR
jgi:hypothetical protein